MDFVGFIQKLIEIHKSSRVYFSFGNCHFKSGRKTCKGSISDLLLVIAFRMLSTPFLPTMDWKCVNNCNLDLHCLISKRKHIVYSISYDCYLTKIASYAI